MPGRCWEQTCHLASATKHLAADPWSLVEGNMLPASAAVAHSTQVAVTHFHGVTLAPAAGHQAAPPLARHDKAPEWPSSSSLRSAQLAAESLLKGDAPAPPSQVPVIAPCPWPGVVTCAHGCRVHAEGHHAVQARAQAAFRQRHAHGVGPLLLAVQLVGGAAAVPAGAQSQQRLGAQA